MRRPMSIRASAYQLALHALHLSMQTMEQADKVASNEVTRQASHLTSWHYAAVSAFTCAYLCCESLTRRRVSHCQVWRISQPSSPHGPSPTSCEQLCTISLTSLSTLADYPLTTFSSLQLQLPLPHTPGPIPAKLESPSHCKLAIFSQTSTLVTLTV
jgi:hypothetical protein